ncbi:hypothetical protein N2152v2_006115 [Parachlorella kessleri]
MEQGVCYTVCRQLASEYVGQEARRAQVVWAKLRSYPAWPAQILPAAEAASRLAGVKQPKDSMGVMFFQDCNVAWVPSKQVFSWSVGMHKRFFANKAVSKAVMEVWDFLGWSERQAPAGWWCSPPPRDAAAAAEAARAPLPALPAQPPVAIKHAPLVVVGKHPGVERTAGKAANTTPGRRGRGRALTSSAAAGAASACQVSGLGAAACRAAEALASVDVSAAAVAAAAAAAASVDASAAAVAAAAAAAVAGACGGGSPEAQEAEPMAVAVPLASVLPAGDVRPVPDAPVEPAAAEAEAASQSAARAAGPGEEGAGMEAPGSLVGMDVDGAAAGGSGGTSLLGCSKCRYVESGCTRCRKWEAKRKSAAALGQQWEPPCSPVSKAKRVAVCSGQAPRPIKRHKSVLKAAAVVLETAIVDKRGGAEASAAPTQHGQQCEQLQQQQARQSDLGKGLEHQEKQSEQQHAGRPEEEHQQLHGGIPAASSAAHTAAAVQLSGTRTGTPVQKHRLPGGQRSLADGALHALKAALPAASPAAPSTSPWAALAARLQGDDSGDEGGSGAPAAAPRALGGPQPAASPLADLPLSGGARAATSPKPRRRPAGPQLRDALRGLINKLKLVVPAVRKVETPNDTPSLVALVDQLFGEALSAEGQRGRTWQEALAALFSWALGQPFEPREVDACFRQSEGTVVKVDKERLADWGLGGLERWHVPLRLQQVRTTITTPAVFPAAAANHLLKAGADSQPAASSAMLANTGPRSKALSGQPQQPAAAGASAAAVAPCASTAGQPAESLPGRWCSEEGRWVDLAWKKCPKETHCVKPLGHTCFCIVTVAGAQTYLRGGISLAMGTQAVQQVGAATEVVVGQPIMRACRTATEASAAMELDTDEDWTTAGEPQLPSGGNAGNSKSQRPSHAPVLTALLPQAQRGAAEGLAGYEKCRRDSQCAKPVGHKGLCTTKSKGFPPLPGGAPVPPAQIQALVAAPARVRSEAPAPASLDGTEVQALKNRKPQYTHVRQNVWLIKRPKRLARDDVAVCNCRVGSMVRARSARQVLAQQQQQGEREQQAAVVKAATKPGPCASEGAAGAMPCADPSAEVAAVLEGVVAAVVAGAQESALGRSSSSMTAALAAAAAVLGSQQGAVMSTRRGCPVGLPASAAAVPSHPAEPPPRDGCGDNCLNRLSLIHCDSRTCPCGERCSNRPFWQLDQPGMEVFLTDTKGWGVRAAQPIPRGTFIVEYAGEVINTAECQRRAEDAKRRNEPHFYMMEMAPGQIIDARVKGNVARLLNSSCDPNCETQKWHDASNGEIRVGIFALRDIEPGEELTYDYFFQHFGLASAAGAYLCTCGAANCRGTMDTAPERTKDYLRRLEVWWADDEAWYAGRVTGYNASRQRHTIKYDDGEVERVFLAGERYRWLDETDQPVGPVHEPEVGAVDQQDASQPAQPAKVKRAPSRASGEASAGGKKLRLSGPPPALASPAEAVTTPLLPPAVAGGGAAAADAAPQNHQVAGMPAAAVSRMDSEPVGEATLQPWPSGEAMAEPGHSSAGQHQGQECGATQEQPEGQRSSQPGQPPLEAADGEVSAGPLPAPAVAAGPDLLGPQDPLPAALQPAVRLLLPDEVTASFTLGELRSRLAGELPQLVQGLQQLALQAAAAARPSRHVPAASAAVVDTASLHTSQGLAPCQAQRLSPPHDAAPRSTAELQQALLQPLPPSVGLGSLPLLPLPYQLTGLPADQQAFVLQLGLASMQQVDQQAQERLAPGPGGAAGVQPEPLVLPPEAEQTQRPVEPQQQQQQEPGLAAGPAGSVSPGSSGRACLGGMQLLPPSPPPMAAAQTSEEAAPAHGEENQSPNMAAVEVGPAPAGEQQNPLGQAPTARLPAFASTASLHGHASEGALLAAAAQREIAAALAPADTPLLAGAPAAPRDGLQSRSGGSGASDVVPQPSLAMPQGEAPLPPPESTANATEAPPPAEQHSAGEPSGNSAQSAELWLAGAGESQQQVVAQHEQQQMGEQLAPTRAVDQERLFEHLRGLAEGLPPDAAAQQYNSWLGQLVALSGLLDAIEPDPQVDNPGAEAVAGRLHGNGKGNLPAGHRAGVSRGTGIRGGSSGSGEQGTRSRRTIRPPSRPYGEEYEEPVETSDASEEEQYASDDEEEYRVEEDEEEEEQPDSPPRRAYHADARQRAAVAATMSPATQAAATIAALAGVEGPPPAGRPPLARRAPGAPAVPAAAVPAAVPGQPQHVAGPQMGGVPAAPSGTVAQQPRPGRRHPTPPSTGLPARTILVAKKLTNSDVTKGRILLPRAAVEANLSFAIGRAHSLLAQDHAGRAWEFTLQSWANGMESRRVYVLEHAGEYVRTHALKPEDVIGISTTEEGSFLIEYNTDEVCNAAETQAAARPGQAGHSPLVPGALGIGKLAGANPLISQNAGRCARSEFCNKPAGHPGFCTRTAAGGRPRGRTADSTRSSRPPSSAGRAPSAAARERGAAAGGAGPPPGAKRTHRLLAQAAQMMGMSAVGGMHGDAMLEIPRPKRARKLTEKAAAMGELAGEEEGEGHYETPTTSGDTAHPQGPGAAAAASGPGDSHPPIFVMAHTEPAPSPGAALRSPALTRNPSTSVLTGQEPGLAMAAGAMAAAGLTGGARAPLGLQGMGKLIPSPVPAPILSPLPALNGSAAVPPNMFARQTQQPDAAAAAPAVDVAEFLAPSGAEEDASAGAQQPRALPPHGAGLPAVVAAVQQHQQPAASQALGLSLPAPVAPPTLATAGLVPPPQLAPAPDLQYAPASAVAAQHAGHQQYTSESVPGGAAYMPALVVAPLNVSGVPGAAAAEPAAQPGAAADAAAAGEAQTYYADGVQWVQGDDGQWYAVGPDGQYYVVAEDGQWYPAESYYQYAEGGYAYSPEQYQQYQMQQAGMYADQQAAAAAYPEQQQVVAAQAAYAEQQQLPAGYQAAAPQLQQQQAQPATAPSSVAAEQAPQPAVPQQQPEQPAAAAAQAVPAAAATAHAPAPSPGKTKPALQVAPSLPVAAPAPAATPAAVPPQADAPPLAATAPLEPPAAEGQQQQQLPAELTAAPVESAAALPKAEQATAAAPPGQPAQAAPAAMLHQQDATAAGATAGLDPTPEARAASGPAVDPAAASQQPAGKQEQGEEAAEAKPVPKGPFDDLTWLDGEPHLT